MEIRVWKENERERSEIKRGQRKDDRWRDGWRMDPPRTCDVTIMTILQIWQTVFCVLANTQSPHKTSHKSSTSLLAVKTQSCDTNLYHLYQQKSALKTDSFCVTHHVDVDPVF